MEKTLRVTVERDGTVKAIYSDALLPVLDRLGGERTVTRASQVEPYDGSGGDRFAARFQGHYWVADMRPSDGPVLGPFKRRADALDAEVEWLREHRGL